MQRRGYPILMTKKNDWTLTFSHRKLKITHRRLQIAVYCFQITDRSFHIADYRLYIAVCTCISIWIGMWNPIWNWIWNWIWNSMWNCVSNAEEGLPYYTSQNTDYRLQFTYCILQVVYCSLHLHLDLNLNVKPILELNLKLNLELNVKLCKQCRGGATPFWWPRRMTWHLPFLIVNWKLHTIYCKLLFTVSRFEIAVYICRLHNNSQVTLLLKKSYKFVSYGILATIISDSWRIEIFIFCFSFCTKLKNAPF